MAQTHPVIPLYAGAVPNSKPSPTAEAVTRRPDGSPRVSQVVQPTLTVYKAAKANGTAVIICPGGGYGMLAMDHEGHDVARRFNDMGITAFVLKYRLPLDASQTDKSITPLLDAQQALRLVRQRAAEFGVHLGRVGLMGFSAGGHLAATTGTHFTTPVGDTKDKTTVRPDFLMLIYPVISLSDSLMHAGSRTNLLGDKPAGEQIKRYSNELQVTAQTPPTFLVHAQDDQVVKVQNSLAFYEACLHHKVPVEMHLYPLGGHGFGMHNKTTQDNWTDRLQNWLAAGGWLGQSR
ncbi:acetyl esterase/lipase [Hymenobacter luteus]|uniref:Acetyl esterase/lipase n=2 Tax=Hymenobacter TaxID=89966 RepID=A0A7W9T4Y2_9BACT|nr:alpha/beta hydrolase [Hymenobacter luteus]MBB6060469.1 acetyl esterase/lipase [Hymenobacter luteus]